MTAVCRRCRGEGYIGDGAGMRLCPTCWGDGDVRFIGEGMLPRDKANAEVARLTADNARLTAENAGLQEQDERNLQEMADMSDEVERLRRQDDRMTQIVNDHSGEIERLTAENARLTAENARLRRESLLHTALAAGVEDTP